LTRGDRNDKDSREAKTGKVTNRGGGFGEGNGESKKTEKKIEEQKMLSGRKAPGRGGKAWLGGVG